MGSPLSPILDDIFVEHLEDKAYTNMKAPIVPRFFKRYADDIFAVVEAATEELLLDQFNSLFPYCISFTIEKKTKRQLPFLDARVIEQRV
ncbi:hypothetical protein M513_11168 [Trichuris suis]|uniref:Reverse transcriptase domain-containing protein n=1 Tax=Trichuris suis TaxID=68888 RepID=A0A085LSI9_9BILA|nr:hypothetical protein M513_11168 [Trichuris suis]